MRSILVIGAGLVATALIKAFKNKTEYEVSLYNRTSSKGEALASSLGIRFIHDLSTAESPEFIVLAISDQALPFIELPAALTEKSIVVHTSGTVQISAINRFTKYGLLYPLDSFGYDGDHHLESTPILVEGNDLPTLNEIKSLASDLSSQIFEVDPKDRPILHMAAVMSNNFVNALLKLAFTELDRHDIKSQVLHKLLKTTLNRALEVGPANSQTGPAIREDISTLKKHIELIDNSDLQDLYILMSKIINPRITDEDLK